MKSFRKTSRGMGLVEVVIGAAIIAVFIAGILTTFRQFFVVGLSNTARLQAAYFAEEGIEVTRAIRDSGWTAFSNLSTSTDYYLGTVGGVWVATTTATTTLPNFTRTVRLGSVYRQSSSNDIVPATSTLSKYLDADARSVTVSVSWVGSGKATTSVQLSTYLTKVF